MTRIPDFSETELEVVREALAERWGRPIEIEVAEAEVRLDPHAFQLTTCPALYWEVDGCHFVVIKTAPTRYRCQFYYRIREMYGTGIEEYDDLGQCVLTLLRVQADHALQRRREAEGGGEGGG